MQMEANKLFAQGMSCEQVSRELSRALSTTHGYLNEYLRTHQITDASRWVSAAVIERVEAAKAQVDTMGPLRHIYEHFEEQIPFHELAVIMICLNNRESRQHAVS